ncbi:hypothetical protein Cni_G15011 [Canna indica]|uniref:Uncharacterized protein n=1 Tax=Canna indica TaxID=4628 RepID=A0AAQ3KCN5_9LILI|nr:hypothetical protein Cni_G15011 [Canna indica]
MAEEKELAHSRRRREQQQISIPYLWEEKPGLLKKGWTSQFAAVTTPPVASPSRLVVSVPYLWEEKPGKPIQTTQSIPDMLAFPHQLELAPLPDQYHYLNPFADEQNHPLNPFLDRAEETTDWQSKADRSFAALPDGWESFSESGSYWNENCWHSASETDGRSSSSSSAAAAEDDRKDTSMKKLHLQWLS